MVHTFIDPRTLELGLRALKMVAVADGRLDVRNRKLMAAAAKALRPPGAEPLEVLEQEAGDRR